MELEAPTPSLSVLEAKFPVRIENAVNLRRGGVMLIELIKRYTASAHIGSCFVHVREQIVPKFVYLEFHIWKPLGSELNFQTVYKLCKLVMHRFHTLCTLI